MQRLFIRILGSISAMPRTLQCLNRTTHEYRGKDKNLAIAGSESYNRLQRGQDFCSLLLFTPRAYSTSKTIAVKRRRTCVRGCTCTCICILRLCTRANVNALTAER